MSLPYPLNDPKYTRIPIDNTDPTIKSLINYLNNFNNYVDLFIKETSNTNKLDSYSQPIQESCNSILSLLNDCANSNDRNKCKSVICKNNILLQNIIIDLYIKLTDITSVDPKKNYKFISFLLLNSYATLIASNPMHKNISDGKNYLCNGASVTPPDPNQPTFNKFQELVADAEQAQETRDTNVKTNNILTYLGWTALGIIIIIIAILIYKYVGKKPLENLDKNVGGFIYKMIK